VLLQLFRWYVYSDVAGWKVALGPFAGTLLSFGSQVRLGDADSNVQVGMSALRKQRQRGDLPAFAEHFGGGMDSLRMAAVPLFSSLCLPVVTIRRGEVRAMKRLPQVLLVDDNPADVVLSREALARGKHQSRISNVQNGEEALAFLRREGQHADAVRPDLVILDLNLPRKDGRAVLAEAKSDKTLRAIPVVVFSTSRLILDIARSYELGANCYVHKPGNLEDYFLAVQSIEEFWFGSASLPREEK
jgi:CheY-like chemotaxis protein